MSTLLAKVGDIVRTRNGARGEVIGLSVCGVFATVDLPNAVVSIARRSLEVIKKK